MMDGRKKFILWFCFFLFLLTEHLYSYDLQSIFQKLEREVDGLLKQSRKSSDDPERYLTIARDSFYLWEYYYAIHDMTKFARYAQLGYDAARRASQLLPNSQEARYWEILNLTAVGIARGPIHAINIVKKIKYQLDNLLTTYPEARFGNGAWLRLLGRVYLFSPSFPLGFGNPTAGEKLIEKAVKMYPQEPRNHIYLSIAYAMNGKLNEAMGEVKTAARLVRETYKRGTLDFIRLDLLTQKLLTLYKKYIEENKKAIPKGVMRSNFVPYGDIVYSSISTY